MQTTTTTTAMTMTMTGEPAQGLNRDTRQRAMTTTTGPRPGNHPDRTPLEQVATATCEARRTLAERYPQVYWTEAYTEGKVTAYWVKDEASNYPLVTVQVDGPEHWSAAIHVEPRPQNRQIYLLRDSKHTGTAPRASILKVLDAYFAEILATQCTTTGRWADPLVRHPIRTGGGYIPDGPLDANILHSDPDTKH